jgi:hypothetical protein
MRKPNYSMERKDRERAKQAKAAAKLEKRAAASGGNRTDDAATPDDKQPAEGEGTKPQG